MNLISDSDKKRLIDFIDENDLDYNIFESDIAKFQITSYDNLSFTIYSYNDKYIVTKYDKTKDKDGSNPFEYYEYNTLPQLLEQLAVYDRSLYKNYWEPTANSIDVPFDKNSYLENWYDEFIKDENYKIEEDSAYKYITYNNEKIKPKLISPFNTLHEVSTINVRELTEVNKLYFEIHPVSCRKKNESYFLKILSNNEDVLKEYINYRVAKKRGLKLFLETLFKNIT